MTARSPTSQGGLLRTAIVISFRNQYDTTAAALPGPLDSGARGAVVAVR